MARVTGFGGYFFRSPNPERTRRWYIDVLGAPLAADGEVMLPAAGPAVFAPFPADTAYFGHSGQATMINLMVDDLDGVLTAARAHGAVVDLRVEQLPFGRFGWITDCDGNRVELWEPVPPSAPSEGS